jgi:hypothetical protein
MSNDKLVRCPECGNWQGDMGTHVACDECGEAMPSFDYPPADPRYPDPDDYDREGNPK